MLANIQINFYKTHKIVYLGFHIKKYVYPIPITLFV